ncbi:MAG: hypothetical protein WBA02_12275 [Jannaschia helgolandensis]|uniref:hypothetical protein n=1 Tax=Jannaschia helgolandensis TaxID=188906 RepID=UPI003C79334C
MKLTTRTLAILATMIVVPMAANADSDNAASPDNATMPDMQNSDMSGMMGGGDTPQDGMMGMMQMMAQVNQMMTAMNDGTMPMDGSGTMPVQRENKG